MKSMRRVSKVIVYLLVALFAVGAAFTATYFVTRNKNIKVTPDEDSVKVPQTLIDAITKTEKILETSIDDIVLPTQTDSGVSVSVLASDVVNIYDGYLVANIAGNDVIATVPAKVSQNDGKNIVANNNVSVVDAGSVVLTFSGEAYFREVFEVYSHYALVRNGESNLPFVVDLETKAVVCNGLVYDEFTFVNGFLVITQTRNNTSFLNKVFDDCYNIKVYDLSQAGSASLVLDYNADDISGSLTDDWDDVVIDYSLIDNILLIKTLYSTRAYELGNSENLNRLVTLVGPNFYLNDYTKTSSTTDYDVALYINGVVYRFKWSSEYNFTYLGDYKFFVERLSYGDASSESLTYGKSVKMYGDNGILSGNGNRYLSQKCYIYDFSSNSLTDAVLSAGVVYHSFTNDAIFKTIVKTALEGYFLLVESDEPLGASRIDATKLTAKYYDLDTLNIVLTYDYDEYGSITGYNDGVYLLVITPNDVPLLGRTKLNKGVLIDSFNQLIEIGNQTSATIKFQQLFGDKFIVSEGTSQNIYNVGGSSVYFSGGATLSPIVNSSVVYSKNSADEVSAVNFETQESVLLGHYQMADYEEMVTFLMKNKSEYFVAETSAGVYAIYSVNNLASPFVSNASHVKVITADGEIKILYHDATDDILRCILTKTVYRTIETNNTTSASSGGSTKTSIIAPTTVKPVAISSVANLKNKLNAINVADSNVIYANAVDDVINESAITRSNDASGGTYNVGSSTDLYKYFIDLVLPNLNGDYVSGLSSDMVAFQWNTSDLNTYNLQNYDLGLFGLNPGSGSPVSLTNLTDLFFELCSKNEAVSSTKTLADGHWNRNSWDWATWPIGTTKTLKFVKNLQIGEEDAVTVTFALQITRSTPTGGVIVNNDSENFYFATQGEIVSSYDNKVFINNSVGECVRQLEALRGVDGFFEAFYFNYALDVEMDITETYQHKGFYFSSGDLNAMGVAGSARSHYGFDSYTNYYYTNPMNFYYLTNNKNLCSNLKFTFNFSRADASATHAIVFRAINDVEMLCASNGKRLLAPSEASAGSGEANLSYIYSSTDENSFLLMGTIGFFEISPVITISNFAYWSSKLGWDNAGNQFVKFNNELSIVFNNNYATVNPLFEITISTNDDLKRINYLNADGTVFRNGTSGVTNWGPQRGIISSTPIVLESNSKRFFVSNGYYLIYDDDDSRNYVTEVGYNSLSEHYLSRVESKSFSEGAAFLTLTCVEAFSNIRIKDNYEFIRDDGTSISCEYNVLLALLGGLGGRVSNEAVLLASFNNLLPTGFTVADIQTDLLATIVYQDKNGDEQFLSFDSPDDEKEYFIRKYLLNIDFDKYQQTNFYSRPNMLSYRLYSGGSYVVSGNTFTTYSSISYENGNYQYLEPSSATGADNADSAYNEYGFVNNDVSGIYGMFKEDNVKSQTGAGSQPSARSYFGKDEFGYSRPTDGLPFKIQKLGYQLESITRSNASIMMSTLFSVERSKIVINNMFDKKVISSAISDNEWYEYVMAPGEKQLVSVYPIMGLFKSDATTRGDIISSAVYQNLMSAVYQNSMYSHYRAYLYSYNHIILSDDGEFDDSRSSLYLTYQYLTLTHTTSTMSDVITNFVGVDYQLVFFAGQEVAGDGETTLVLENDYWFYETTNATGESLKTVDENNIGAVDKYGKDVDGENAYRELDTIDASTNNEKEEIQNRFDVNPETGALLIKGLSDEVLASLGITTSGSSARVEVISTDYGFAYSQSLYSLPVPVKIGYEFVGWRPLVETKTTPAGLSVKQLEFLTDNENFCLNGKLNISNSGARNATGSVLYYIAAFKPIDGVVEIEYDLAQFSDGSVSDNNFSDASTWENDDGVALEYDASKESIFGDTRGAMMASVSLEDAIKDNNRLPAPSDVGYEIVNLLFKIDGEFYFVIPTDVGYVYKIISSKTLTNLLTDATRYSIRHGVTIGEAIEFYIYQDDYANYNPIPVVFPEPIQNNNSSANMQNINIAGMIKSIMMSKYVELSVYEDLLNDETSYNILTAKNFSAIVDVAAVNYQLTISGALVDDNNVFEFDSSGWEEDNGLYKTRVVGKTAGRIGNISSLTDDYLLDSVAIIIYTGSRGECVRLEFGVDRRGGSNYAVTLKAATKYAESYTPGLIGTLLDDEGLADVLGADVGNIVSFIIDDNNISIEFNKINKGNMLEVLETEYGYSYRFYNSSDDEIYFMGAQGEDPGNLLREPIATFVSAITRKAIDVSVTYRETDYNLFAGVRNDDEVNERLKGAHSGSSNNDNAAALIKALDGDEFYSDTLSDNFISSTGSIVYAPEFLQSLSTENCGYFFTSYKKAYGSLSLDLIGEHISLASISGDEAVNVYKYLLSHLYLADLQYTNSGHQFSFNNVMLLEFDWGAFVDENGNLLAPKINGNNYTSSSFDNSTEVYSYYYELANGVSIELGMTGGLDGGLFTLNITLSMPTDLFNADKIVFAGFDELKTTGYEVLGSFDGNNDKTLFRNSGLNAVASEDVAERVINIKNYDGYYIKTISVTNNGTSVNILNVEPYYDLSGGQIIYNINPSGITSGVINGTHINANYVTLNQEVRGQSWFMFNIIAANYYSTLSIEVVYESIFVIEVNNTIVAFDGTNGNSLDYFFQAGFSNGARISSNSLPNEFSAKNSLISSVDSITGETIVNYNGVSNLLTTGAHFIVFEPGFVMSDGFGNIDANPNNNYTIFIFIGALGDSDSNFGAALTSNSRRVRSDYVNFIESNEIYLPAQMMWGII